MLLLTSRCWLGSVDYNNWLSYSGIVRFSLLYYVSSLMTKVGLLPFQSRSLTLILTFLLFSLSFLISDPSQFFALVVARMILSDFWVDSGQFWAGFCIRFHRISIRSEGMLLFLVHLLIILIFIKIIFVIISKKFHVYWQLNFVTVFMLDRCIYPIVWAPSYYIYLHVFSLIVFPLFFMCTNRVDLLCLGSGFDRQVIVAKDFLNVEILPMLIKQEIG